MQWVCNFIIVVISSGNQTLPDCVTAVLCAVYDLLILCPLQQYSTWHWGGINRTQGTMDTLFHHATDPFKLLQGNSKKCCNSPGVRFRCLLSSRRNRGRSGKSGACFKKTKGFVINQLQLPESSYTRHLIQVLNGEKLSNTLLHFVAHYF